MTEEVMLTENAFGIPGTRIATWYGPLYLPVHRLRGASWEEGLYEIRESARAAARALGGNAVIGVEIECDPFDQEGAHISLKGTAVRCVPLFAGVEMVYP